MELVFQEKQLDYLGRVLDQTVTQELTAEVIVPDSCADADRVVDAFGTLLVRAEECTAGSASVSGEVQAGILFVTEDGRLERLETVIPFSARRGWEGEQSDCRLQCVCRLCSVDARLVHSRKLLVRVGVSCTLTVYAAFARTLHDFPEPAPTLQLRRKRLPLRLPRGLGEKSFSLNEEIEIPASKPPVERLLKCVYALDTAERKTIGNKAVFKGRLTVHILYEAPDGSLQRQETELPFSQFAELEQDLDEGDLTVFLALTSAETEPDGQLDCRRLLLSAGILAQCTVCGEQPVELIEDAYCLDAELKPQWETWEMEGILDVQTFRETAQAAGREPASAIADGWVLAGEPVRRQENGMAKIELPLAANVLFTDPAGKLQGVNGAAFALIAMDSVSYGFAASGSNSRARLVAYLLAQELPGGGWDYSGKTADPDQTAMVLQALAPYRTQANVSAAIDRALNVLSGMQKDDGSFDAWGASSSESISQVLVALCALGIDPAKDSRFVRANGAWLVSALMSFRVQTETGLAFGHTNRTANYMATEQAGYALAAYERFLAGQPALYTMTDTTYGTHTCVRYRDTARHWAQPYVCAVTEQGLMNGVGNDCFDPEGTLNRAMLATVLWRASGSPAADGGSFADVPAGQWYSTAVSWAQQSGIVQGVGENRFAPMDSITREQLAVMLWRASGSPGSTQSLAAFPDAGTCSNWASTALAWAVERGILNGMDGRLAPGGTATRAQAAAMLTRYLQ